MRRLDLAIAVFLAACQPKPADNTDAHLASNGSLLRDSAQPEDRAAPATNLAPKVDAATVSPFPPADTWIVAASDGNWRPRESTVGQSTVVWFEPDYFLGRADYVGMRAHFFTVEEGVCRRNEALEVGFPFIGELNLNVEKGLPYPRYQPSRRVTLSNPHRGCRELTRLLGKQLESAWAVVTTDECGVRAISDLFERRRGRWRHDQRSLRPDVDWPFMATWRAGYLAVERAPDLLATWLFRRVGAKVTPMPTLPDRGNHAQFRPDPKRNPVRIPTEEEQRCADTRVTGLYTFNDEDIIVTGRACSGMLTLERWASGESDPFTQEFPEIRISERSDAPLAIEIEDSSHIAVVGNDGKPLALTFNDRWTVQPAQRPLRQEKLREKLAAYGDRFQLRRVVVETGAVFAEGIYQETDRVRRPVLLTDHPVTQPCYFANRSADPQ